MTEFAFPSDSNLKERLGENGYKRATSVFSRERMSEAFYQGLLDASKSHNKKGAIYSFLALWKLWFASLIIAFIAIVYKISFN